MTHEYRDKWNGLDKGDLCSVDGGEKSATYIFQHYIVPPSGVDKAYVSVVEQLDPRGTRGGKPSPGRRRDRMFVPTRVHPLS